MTEHFILCGVGRIGKRVLALLQAAGIQIVAVEYKDVSSLPEMENVTYVQGDCREEHVLKQAGIEKAKGILILTSDDLVNLSAGLVAHKLNPSLRIVLRMFNQSLLPRLAPKSWNVASLSASGLTAPVLAMIARTGEALGMFTLQDGRRMQISEIQVRSQSPLRDLRLEEVPKRNDVKLIGYEPRGESYRFLSEMLYDAKLLLGEKLIVCGTPEVVAQLRSKDASGSEPELQWAGSFTRGWRVCRRTWREIDWPVKLCTLLLIAVVFISTMILHWTMRDCTIGDAFFQTISLMATMAPMETDGQELEEWQKFYVSGMRLLGAAFFAAFIAILTNYLVRAQLKGALELSRVPEGGHVVVCGLGNVGFRTVEALLAEGENVVVVEQSSENPFVFTARRNKAAVIIADATMPDVLREAHVDTAKAVVVTTDDELVNVEIATQVRDINPAQRVVLRLTDSQLAETLREGMQLRLAFSIPDLAAPAFVAGLFGDRIHNVFYIGGRVLAAVDLVVESGESYVLGKQVDKLAADYRMRIISLTNAAGEIITEAQERQLVEGDCLTFIVDLADLRRLMQREQSRSDSS